MIRPADHSAYQAVDRYGIHEIEGPLMVGGVEFLIPGTGLFRDFDVCRKLTTRQRFEAFLKFREQAFKTIAAELVSASKQPVDLVLFTAEDGQRFRNDYWFHYILFRDKSHISVPDDQTKENGADDAVTVGVRGDLMEDYKNNKESRMQQLRYDQMYLAYRKGLLNLDMSQLNNDPKSILQWLKSIGWSELSDVDLRRGLQSHMNLLKEHDMTKPESKKAALERINVEMGSALERRLYTSDWATLMGHYYNRMKVRNLARVCSVQAQAAGVILVKQALPLPEICKEQAVSTTPEVLKFPSMKQTVTESFKGWAGSLHRMREEFGRGAMKFGRGAERFRRGASGRFTNIFVPIATVATAAGVIDKEPKEFGAMELDFDCAALGGR
ncbi:hypothetical protein EJB05_10458 [Eragrostis curvula]|uniref:Uncharacterized protein n=1 Tax=Eragrostis curvula TaxID=38414 RepID=A0A5J9VMY9_9POAL|nr:hypothetical protein EJB05_10458 [Eragrostis curvula]